jgi:hypothetical protein
VGGNFLASGRASARSLEIWAMTWRIEMSDLVGLAGFLALGVVLMTFGPLP